MPVVYFLAKLLLLLYGTVWIRASLPRLRYDQLIGLGWKYLIEASFLWVATMLVLRMARAQKWEFIYNSQQMTATFVAVASVAVSFCIYYVLRSCIPREDETVDEYASVLTIEESSI